MSSETVSDADWLDEAARYFEKRPTGGEDMAFWANVSNAERCRSIASALRSTPVASGVEVKPLEWVKHPNVEAWRAETMLGSYKVFAVALPATWTFYGHAGELIERKSPDVTEAKAAAEADYRNRILSALLPKATAPAVSERREIETEAEALQRLAEGERIVYSRDGETAWFQNGDRAFVSDDVMMDLHLSGSIETVNDGEDEDWHEWAQITAKGRAALEAFVKEA